MCKVIIIGASGHGKVIADIVNKSGDMLVGFLDDGIEVGTQIAGVSVLGSTKDCVNYSDCKFIIAIGNAKIRKHIAESISVNWYNAIHPNAILSTIDVKIGDGCAIMANAVINSGATIGNHCIVNTGAIVEHDNVIDDYVHISPNATLAGTVKVGNSTHIGVGACVKNNTNICANCTIGAGAVVVKNIDKSGTYVGVPARNI